MAAKITKCVHCSWIDYLENGPKRCPKCGSVTQILDVNLFGQEKIVAKIMDTRLRQKEVEISFHTLSEQFNAIVGNSLEKIYPVDDIRNRIEFMMKVYVWGLLEKSPQLWVYVDLPISGLKELIMLSEEKFTEQLQILGEQLEELSIQLKSADNKFKEEFFAKEKQMLAETNSLRSEIDTLNRTIKDKDNRIKELITEIESLKRR